MAAPVMLVHGWGGSFDATWRRSGFTDLLADAGRRVIGVDLLGHGAAPKPHDVEAYSDLGERVVDALPDEPVDAIGFSLGAMTLLHVAAAMPHRFNRLVLAGVGRNLFEPDEESSRRIIEALEGRGDAGDNLSRMFVNYASELGNDVVALTAIMRRPRAAFTVGELVTMTVPTLIAIGDQDFAGPGDPLVEALPDATLKILCNTDHFATPKSFAFIDAALSFLDAIPH